MSNNKIFLSVKLLAVIIVFALVSCSNDFLHVEQKIGSPVKDTIYMTDFDSQFDVSFNLAKAGNAHWRVLQYPAWMTISPMEDNFMEGKSSFQIVVPDKTFISTYGAINLPLVFDVDGVGLVQYPLVFFNFGNPGSYLSTNELMFDYRSAASFSIYNSGGGFLKWEVKDKPAWISLSSQNGLVTPNSNEQINLSVSRLNMQKGSYSGEITLSTNSISKILKLKVSMKVTDPSLPGTIGNIEGEVVDADFCKATGLMVIAARNPNRLYTVKSDQSVKTIDLDKIPISVTISESGDVIAGIFTNTDLSLFSTENLSILKTIKTGIIPSEVALGGNGWAYVSPKQYDSNYVLSINLNTGEVIKNKEYMNGLTLLKKVPGKNLLYGSKIGWSPDFLVVFDISKGAVNEVVDQWWITLQKFWMSEDGLRVFSGMRKIYRSPEYQGKGSINDAPVLDGEIEQLPGSIFSMDHSSALKELFIAYTGYNSEVGCKVSRIDDAGYFIKKSFAVNNITIEENNTLLTLIPEVPYMFIDKLGKELTLVERGSGNNGKAYWRYEKIKLN